jgi:hypothetical protein
MSAKPRLDKAIALAKAHPEIQQFGQANDDWVWGGATACTHTCCQFLARLWKGRSLTLNQINALAGMPHNARSANGQPRGMNNTELARFIAAVGLPYVIRFGLSFETILSYSNRGPVLIAVRYGSTPKWKGFTYHGVVADGKPNGFARPTSHAGKTQLSGFENGRHADLVLGYLPVKDASGKVVRYDEWRKEPNHGSPARPEKPPFDVITTAQGKREYEDYSRLLGNKAYAAIPTKNLPV